MTPPQNCAPATACLPSPCPPYCIPPPPFVPSFYVQNLCIPYPPLCTTAPPQIYVPPPPVVVCPPPCTPCPLPQPSCQPQQCKLSCPPPSCKPCCPPPFCKPCCPPPSCHQQCRPKSGCCGGGCGGARNNCGTQPIVCIPIRIAQQQVCRPICGSGSRNQSGRKGPTKRPHESSGSHHDKQASYNNCNFYLTEIPKSLRDQFGFSNTSPSEVSEECTEESYTDETEECRSLSIYDECMDEQQMDDECEEVYGNGSAGNSKNLCSPMDCFGMQQWAAYFPGLANCFLGAGGGYSFGGGAGGVIGPGGGGRFGPVGGRGRFGPGGGIPFGRGRGVGPGRGRGGGMGRGRGGEMGRGRGGGMGRERDGKFSTSGDGSSGRRMRGRPYDPCVPSGGGGTTKGYNDGRGNRDYSNGYGNGGYSFNNKPNGSGGYNNDSGGAGYHDGRGNEGIGGYNDGYDGRGRQEYDYGRDGGRYQGGNQISQKSSRATAQDNGTGLGKKSGLTAKQFSKTSGYRPYSYSNAELTKKSDAYINKSLKTSCSTIDIQSEHAHTSTHKTFPSTSKTYGTSTNRFNTIGVGPSKSMMTSQTGGVSRSNFPPMQTRSEPNLRGAIGDGDEENGIPVYRTTTQTSLQIIERPNEPSEIRVIQRPVQEVVSYQGLPPDTQHSRINLNVVTEDLTKKNGIKRKKRPFDPCHPRKTCMQYHTRRLHRLCSFTNRRKRRLSQIHKPIFCFKQPPCPIRETIASILRKHPPASCNTHDQKVPAFHEYCHTDECPDTNRYPLLTREFSPLCHENVDHNVDQNAVNQQNRRVERRGAKRKQHHR